MTPTCLLINTHPAANPDFTVPLLNLIRSEGFQAELVSGYEFRRPSHIKYDKVILSGVPLDADYSLSEKDTQTLISDHFSWIQDWHKPLLGICYGHQILAHLFGGSVAPFARTVNEKRYPLELDLSRSKSGIFAGMTSIAVFAEHRDYVAEVPDDFVVLSSRNSIPYIIHNPQREFYGVQFVPEQSGQKAQQALINFLYLEP